MNPAATYVFEDLSVCLYTSSQLAIHFFDTYTYFRQSERPLDKPICIYFTETDPLSSLTESWPDDAVMDAKDLVEIKGHRWMYRYSRGESEKWIVYERFGSIHIDYQKNEIHSRLDATADHQDILPFIMLIIQPLIRIFQNYGYLFLHAACLTIGNKGVVIAGTSGRGKSTATYALIQSGYPVLTDEYTLIRKKEGRFTACTLANWIKLNKTGRQILFGDVIQVPDDGEIGDDYLIRLDHLFATPTFRMDAIDFLFTLEQTGLSDTTVHMTDALSVVPEILPISLSLANRRMTEQGMTVLSDLLSNVSCRKIHFGTDMALFASAIEQAVLSESGDDGADA